MQKKNRKAQNDIISEPDITWDRSLVRKFTSFEEMNEADAAEKAGMTPYQLLANAVIRIKLLYAEQLKTAMDKNLKFRAYGEPVS